MDAERFDSLTRALSQDTSRRKITRLLGGLALGGLLPSLASAAKKGDHHEKGSTGKMDGTGNRKKDNDRHKTGKAERKTGKRRHQTDQTGKSKTGLQDSAEPDQTDSAEPETDTAGGREANAPRDGKKGKQDTDETPTASTARDGATDLHATDGTVRASATSETCRSAGDSCSRDRQCCSRRCTGRGFCRCNDANPCPADMTCQNGQCVCPDGTKVCNGACIASSKCCSNTDCPSGQACDGGTCGGGCQAEDQQTTCGQDGCGQKTNNCGQSVDCGGCGSSASCVDGHCEAISCVPEDLQTTCAGEACGTRTNNCRQDVDCGGCAGSKTCQNAQCVCPDDRRDCGDGCADTQTDPKHCGSCGTTCDGGTGTCQNGACATAEVCDGVDNNFDGAVDEGTLCPANQVCQSGRCGCPAGTQDCDGDSSCESLGTNERCASCSDRCRSDQVCQAGTCVCPDGTKACNDTCILRDACCGNADCPSGQVCQSGECVPAPPVCGNGSCEAGETCSSCPADCGACQAACGNGTCEDGETCSSCPQDCGSCPAVCGDGVCNGSETCHSCPGDCGPCTGTECTTDADCYSGLICQDGTCHGTECIDYSDCVPATCCHAGSCVPVAQAPSCNGVACDGGCKEFTLDCDQGYCACWDGLCVAVAVSAVCGDGMCNGDETCSDCPQDCGPCPAVCGNGTCEEGEDCSTCPQDCGSCPPECTVDAECVGSACCHPGGCVHWTEAPVCGGTACTADCQQWTMDCGQGYCGCVEGQCVAVLTPECGNGWCEEGETCSTCPQDCGACNCTMDTDCVPAECCHPYSCVPSAEAPICGGACDTGMVEGTFDFGGGCFCLDGQCGAVYSWD